MDLFEDFRARFANGASEAENGASNVAKGDVAKGDILYSPCQEKRQSEIKSRYRKEGNFKVDSPSQPSEGLWHFDGSLTIDEL